MRERNESERPAWAERERAGDMGWIRENVYLFWPLAQRGYQAVGRGAIVVDTRITMAHAEGAGHPSGYVDQKTVEQTADEATQRLVNDYDPSREFVTALFKTRDRVSSYRIGVISAEQRENLDERVKAEQKIEDRSAEATPTPPDLETLMQWESEGMCEATDGCVVEPDGRCEHGHPSWLLELGLI